MLQSIIGRVFSRRIHRLQMLLRSSDVAPVRHQIKGDEADRDSLTTVPEEESQDDVNALSDGDHMRSSTDLQPSNSSLLNNESQIPSHMFPNDMGNLDENVSYRNVLEDFMKDETHSFKLVDIRGHVVEFSMDQLGSQFIEQKLETATIEEKFFIFQELKPHALILMTDGHGIRVIITFLEHGITAQKMELAEKCLGHVFILSLQLYGSLVIQKALDVLDVEQKMKFVRELDTRFISCLFNRSACCVIQRCVECVAEEDILFIFSSCIDQIIYLSIHPIARHIIKKIVKCCKDPMTRSRLIDEIVASVNILVHDEFGNHVVQHAIEHGKPEERSKILEKLAGRVVRLSQHKFAFNVIEKCLDCTDPFDRKLIINEILDTSDHRYDPFKTMLKDRFGNFIIQKVLEICDDEQRQLIRKRIEADLNR